MTTVRDSRTMTDSALDVWAGWWRNGAEIARTGLRLAEMAQAAGTVIDSRSRTLLAAARNPADADHRELARMLPEKVEAFSQAGASALGDLCALQVDALATWQQLMGVALSGKPASLADLDSLVRRSSRMTDRLVASGGKALDPVHRRTLSNARRLAHR